MFPPLFGEDPLRVLRVARFAARYAHLGFRIADETLTLMREMTHAGELEHLTPERVWKETESALTTRNPQGVLPGYCAIAVHFAFYSRKLTPCLAFRPLPGGIRKSTRVFIP